MIEIENHKTSSLLLSILAPRVMSCGCYSAKEKVCADNVFIIVFSVISTVLGGNLTDNRECIDENAAKLYIGINITVIK